MKGKGRLKRRVKGEENGRRKESVYWKFKLQCE